MRMKNEYIELELMNGNRVILQKDWGKVYSLKEKNCHCIKFTATFPFLRISRKRYVSFKFRTTYETLNSCDDPRYNVNCTLIELAKLFGEYVKQFELNVVENDVNVFH